MGEFNESLSKNRSTTTGDLIDIASIETGNFISDSYETAGEIATSGSEAAAKKVESIADKVKFTFYYYTNICFRQKINTIYKGLLSERSVTKVTPEDGWFSTLVNRNLKESAASINIERTYIAAIEDVYKRRLAQAQAALSACLQNTKARVIDDEPKPQLSTARIDPGTLIRPFDRRMDRLFVDPEGQSPQSRIPFDTNYQQASTTGFIMSERAIIEKDQELNERSEEIYKDVQQQKEKMRQDDFYIGLSSIVNTYSITKLYGSKGGEYLLDQKGKRAWYEIDETPDSVLGFSKNPTTTSIISWGNNDPYGRTPYHFTDFAFCKYWNIIPNNRMITLRRFAAPIYDNMKFPGMGGFNDSGEGADSGSGENESLGVNGREQTEGTNISGDDTATNSSGSGKATPFPPMATAVTYFGEETGNKISEMLKFMTGFNWEEAKANLYEVTPNANPDSKAGPGGRLMGGMTKYAEMFNIGLGNFNTSAILNDSQLPPDPYIDGPYENRVIGPVNRIDEVKKRKAGLQFENKLAIVFEYKGRPIGGVNPKAALLDILSNFLVIGSASAVFWGGQHRFMGQPQKYPFIGGDKGIQQWYRGDPIGWGSTSMQNLAKQVPNVLDSGSNFFKEILGVFSTGSIGGAFNKATEVLSGSGVAGNFVRSYAAEKSSGQIPYLKGMSALLIGEPVGEWHVTIGNPLNPIAMIGNLICNNIELELNDELGPDDFPTELKITVNLEHAMARDRDSIQSIFNRGMGRIYELPDNLTGSADYETAVDSYTKDGGKYSPAGRNPDLINIPIGDSGTNYGKYGRAAVRPNALKENLTVWNRPPFRALSGTQNLDLSLGKIEHKSQFRAADWVYLKSLK